MNDQQKFAESVRDMINSAQELIKGAEKVSLDTMTREAVDKELNRIDQNIELTKNRAENITSRLEAGIISAEVAKKQMRKLLTEETTKLMADILRYKGVAPNLTITTEEVEKVMQKIDLNLS